MTGTLKRQMGLLALVAIVVGTNIGGSMYVLIPQLMMTAGPAIWLAYAIGSVVAIFSILYCMQVAEALPATGGHYVLLTRVLSPLIGWVVTFAAVISIIATNCFLAWGFAKFLYLYYPLGSLSPDTGVLIYAAIIIVVFGIINYVGINIASWAQGLMMLLFIMGMLIFGIGGLMNMKPGNLLPLFPTGMDPFITAVVISTFAWTAFMVVLELGGEIKNPKRTIPKALIISYLIVLGLYIIMPLGLASVMKWSDITPDMANTAVVTAAGTFLPSWGVFVFIFLAAAGAFLTSILGMMMVAARGICAFGRDKLVPTACSHISEKFGTPDLALLFVTLLSLGGILIQATLDKYALIVVMFVSLLMLVASTATWLMPKKTPEIYKRAAVKFSSFWRWFSWIGGLIFFGSTLLFGFMVDLTSKQNPGVVSIIFLSVVILPAIYWFIRKAYLKGKNIDLPKLQTDLTGALLKEVEEKET